MYISHKGTRKKKEKNFPKDRLQKIGSCPQAVSSGAEGPTRVPRFRLGLPWRLCAISSRRYRGGCHGLCYGHHSPSTLGGLTRAHGHPCRHPFSPP